MQNIEKFYLDGRQMKAEIDVYYTNERDAPPIGKCRYAALGIKGGGYVVYDRLLNRIVNGVFLYSSDALHVAKSYNEGNGMEDMSPNGFALGLIYPEVK